MSYTNTNHKFVFVYHKHKKSFGIAPILLSRVIIASPTILLEIAFHVWLHVTLPTYVGIQILTRGRLVSPKLEDTIDRGLSTTGV
jgi:hypothetical protein